MEAKGTIKRTRATKRDCSSMPIHKPVQINSLLSKLEDVKLMKDTVSSRAEVKASGGVKNREDALKMIEAGATRIGTSKGVEIIREMK